MDEVNFYELKMRSFQSSYSTMVGIYILYLNLYRWRRLSSRKSMDIFKIILLMSIILIIILLLL